ncbi:hypothetical protein N7512_000820 [Penicillium capsulatum]|nr:hypothetical protein N7512_000820 [Penicillium capsulatum]
MTEFQDGRTVQSKAPTDERITRATHLIGCRCPETRDGLKGPRLCVGKGKMCPPGKVRTEYRQEEWDLPPPSTGPDSGRLQFLHVLVEEPRRETENATSAPRIVHLICDHGLGNHLQKG